MSKLGNSSEKLLRRPGAQGENGESKKVYLLLCVLGIVLPTRNSSVGPGERAAPGLLFRQLFRESHRRLFWIGCPSFVRGARGIPFARKGAGLAVRRPLVADLDY